MVRQSLLTALTVSLMLCLPLADCWGRGRGGGGGRGGFSGGGRGGFGGGGHSPGGFGGGAGRSMSGFGGGGRSPGGMGGGGFGGGGPSFGGVGGGRPGAGAGRSPGGFGGGGLGGGNEFGQRGGGLGGQRPGGLGGGGFDRGGLGQGGPGQFGAGGERFGAGGAAGGVHSAFGGPASTPSRGQLNSFLGLPSDGGLHHQAGGGRGDNFDVNRGAAEGPRGGRAAGATVTGPGGNTVGRAAAVGPYGGTATARGVEGAGGASAVRGAAVGPGGRVAAGSAVRGPQGGAAARGAVAGPRGYAAGFARVSPSGRYTCAAAVRGNYHHWGVYGSGWYTSHPGAWYAAGWGAGYAWRAATWNSVGAWMSYYPADPVYYDYGNNVTYQDNSVYVNGQDVGTSEQYYDQAASLATAGTQAQAPDDGDWLPLGVFALTKPDQTSSDFSIQLAVNKQGVVRGNYTDTKTDKSQLVQGSVDKKTQRVAFTVGDNKSNVVETGVYNLTKDEAPCLIHFGQERTEQWLLVRLKNPDAGNS